MEKFCKYCGKPLKERVACYDRELYCDCEQTQLANELGRKIRTTQNILNAIKPEIPLALDGGTNGVRGNYYKLLEKQKSSQISITISSDFCL